MPIINFMDVKPGDVVLVCDNLAIGILTYPETDMSTFDIMEPYIPGGDKFVNVYIMSEQKYCKYFYSAWLQNMYWFSSL